MASTRAEPEALAPYRLTPLETASGMIFGVDRGVEPLPTLSPDVTPRDALEAAVLPAVRRSPCGVSFSGGLDSSAVLAVAVDTARRHGLPPPVPVTLRFPGVETADETHWQEAVVRHLDLHDWEQIQIGDELDVVGPYAAAVLSRHGHVWPFNAHFHLPIFERLAGGAVLTGAGGDELFWPPRWARAAMVLAGRVRPQPRDVLRLAVAASPRILRTSVLRHRGEGDLDLPWLRPAARRAVARAWFRDEGSEPLRFDTSIRRTWWPSRYRRVVTTTLAVVAGDVGAVALHPLEDPRFLAAVAQRAGAVGYPSRAHALQDIVGDLLPAALLNRRSKATFDAAFWQRHSQAFVGGWDGTGVDTALVDPDVLRSLWSQARPHALTWSLLQWLWVDRNADSALPEVLE